jgi:hypothetical protein
MGYPSGATSSIFGYEFAMSREDERNSILKMTRDYESMLPPNFGYDHFSMLGESYIKDIYLIITKRFLMASDDPYLEEKGVSVLPLFFTRGYSSSDFEKLKNDPSVDKIYTNGEFDILHINPK